MKRKSICKPVKETNKSQKLNNAISIAGYKSKNNCTSFGFGSLDFMVLTFIIVLVGAEVTCVFYNSRIFKLVIS